MNTTRIKNFINKNKNIFNYEIGHTFIATEFGSKEHTEGQNTLMDYNDNLEAHWVLPFPICTVVSAQAHTHMTTIHESKSQKLSGVHKFTFCSENNVMLHGEFWFDNDRNNYKEFHDIDDQYTFTVYFGTAEDSPNGFLVIRINSGKVLKTDNPKALKIEIWKTFGNPEFQTYAEQVRLAIGEGITNALIQFSIFMADTKYFVISETSAIRKKGKLKEKGLTLYRTLHVSTIRKQYIKHNVDNTERSTTIGYERRRHLRTYKHDRYINMKGITVIIESTWIGATQYFDKDKQILYKVKMD